MGHSGITMENVTDKTSMIAPQCPKDANFCHFGSYIASVLILIIASLKDCICVVVF